jgi:hypothetical protein
VGATVNSFDPGVDTVFLATGLEFADALSGGAAAGALDSALLLVQRDCVPEAVNREIDRLDPQRVVVLGGNAALSDAVVARRQCDPPHPVCATYVSDPTPPVNGTETVFVTSNLLTSPTVVTARYKSSSESYATETNAYGYAEVSFPIGPSFSGFTAPVDVNVGDRAFCQTSFTVR